MRYAWAMLLVAGCIAGCEKPAPVQIEDDPDAVEVSAVEQVDPDVDVPSIDSTGVLPKEQLRVSGYLLINDIRLDWGQGAARLTTSSVLLNNRGAGVLENGKLFGYYGLPLRSVTLNGQPMFEIPHVVRVVRGGRQDTVRRGVEYFRNITGSYSPNQPYVWGLRASLLTDTVVVPTLTPEDLTVISPAAGDSVPRGRDLRVQWNGNVNTPTGTFSIIVSRANPVTQKMRPLLQFRPRRNQGHAVVPARVLQNLEPGIYAFTFILANSYRIAPQHDPQGEVIVQAASINSIVFALQ